MAPLDWLGPFVYVVPVLGFLLIYFAVERGVEAALETFRRLHHTPTFESAGELECPNCGAAVGRTAEQIELSKTYRCSACGKVFVGDDLL